MNGEQIFNAVTLTYISLALVLILIALAYIASKKQPK